MKKKVIVRKVTVGKRAFSRMQKELLRKNITKVQDMLQLVISEWKSHKTADYSIKTADTFEAKNVRIYEIDYDYVKTCGEKCTRPANRMMAHILDEWTTTIKDSV